MGGQAQQIIVVAGAELYNFGTNLRSMSGKCERGYCPLRILCVCGQKALWKSKSDALKREAFLTEFLQGNGVHT